jgi:hypothetical protein
LGFLWWNLLIRVQVHDLTRVHVFFDLTTLFFQWLDDVPVEGARCACIHRGECAFVYVSICVSVTGSRKKINSIQIITTLIELSYQHIHTSFFCNWDWCQYKITPPKKWCIHKHLYVCIFTSINNWTCIYERPRYKILKLTKSNGVAI